MPNKDTIFQKLKQVIWLSALTFILSLVAGTTLYVFAAFTEPAAAPSASDQDFAQNILGANNANNDFDSSAVAGNNDGSIVERLEYFTDYIFDKQRVNDVYGRGWVASSSGESAATTSLTMAACEAATNWEWFEDGNGDGDYYDPEDGICVLATTTYSAIGSWNGNGCSTQQDNSYIADYTCSGTFPNGTVVSYSGINSSCTADNSWNDGDCALCQADCYDGRKNLPDQGGYTTGSEAADGGGEGFLTTEVLKSWQGTRLPTSQDFFGFCGATTGDSDNTVGDSNYYSTGASTDQTIGDNGHNAGRGGEYMDLSNSLSYEWLSERHGNFHARVAGFLACSVAYHSGVEMDRRFRAVFRP